MWLCVEDATFPGHLVLRLCGRDPWKSLLPFEKFNVAAEGTPTATG